MILIQTRYASSLRNLCVLRGSAVRHFPNFRIRVKDDVWNEIRRRRFKLRARGGYNPFDLFLGLQLRGNYRFSTVGLPRPRATNSNHSSNTDLSPHRTPERRRCPRPAPLLGPSLAGHQKSGPSAPEERNVCSGWMSYLTRSGGAECFVGGLFNPLKHVFFLKSNLEFSQQGQVFFSRGSRPLSLLIGPGRY